MLRQVFEFRPDGLVYRRLPGNQGTREQERVIGVTGEALAVLLPVQGGHVQESHRGVQGELAADGLVQTVLAHGRHVFQA